MASPEGKIDEEYKHEEQSTAIDDQKASLPVHCANAIVLNRGDVLVVPFLSVKERKGEYLDRRTHHLIVEDQVRKIGVI